MLSSFIRQASEPAKLLTVAFSSCYHPWVVSFKTESLWDLNSWAERHGIAWYTELWTAQFVRRWLTDNKLYHQSKVSPATTDRLCLLSSSVSGADGSIFTNINWPCGHFENIHENHITISEVVSWDSQYLPFSVNFSDIKEKTRMYLETEDLSVLLIWHQGTIV